MRPRRSVNDRHKWSRFGSPFPFRANNKGGKNRKIGEIVRRLPAVSAPRIAPDPSTWILDDVVKPENRIVFASAGRRERGAGRFAVLFSRLPIPARMDRSVHVSLSLLLVQSTIFETRVISSNDPIPSFSTRVQLRYFERRAVEIAPFRSTEVHVYLQ